MKKLLFLSLNFFSNASAKDMPVTNTLYLIDYGKYDIAGDYRDTIVITCAPTKKLLKARGAAIVTLNPYFRAPNPDAVVNYNINDSHDWVIDDDNFIFDSRQPGQGPAYNIGLETKILDKDSCIGLTDKIKKLEEIKN